MLKLVPPRKDKTPYWYVRGSYLGISVDRSTKASEKRLATQVRDKIKREIERGEFAQPGEPTFLSAAVAYMKAGGEARYVEPLLRHFKEQPLKAISQAAIDSASLTLYPTASPATRNRQVYSVVSAILKNAGIKDKITRPKGADGQKKTDWLWPNQAFRLFVAADKEDAEFAVFLRTLCYTGLRLSEALNLRIDNTSLTEELAYVERTKNGTPRAVYLPPVVVAALGNHPRGMDRRGERVFRFTKCGRLYTILNRVKAAAGPEVAFAGFHTFRHTWATWMRRYGSLDTVGLVATGAWRDEKSAARYQHVIVTEEARKARLLPTENKTSFRGESVEKSVKRQNAQ